MIPRSHFDTDRSPVRNFSDGLDIVILARTDCRAARNFPLQPKRLHINGEMYNPLRSSMIGNSGCDPARISEGPDQFRNAISKPGVRICELARLTAVDITITVHQALQKRHALIDVSMQVSLWDMLVVFYTEHPKDI